MSNSQSYRRQSYKIIIIGESYVGKTSIMQRFVNDTFEENLLATIGIDLMKKSIKIKDETINLDIWDTAGQERFHAITRSYYRGANGIFLVFDFSDEKSFESIDNWFNGFKDEIEENTPIFLIGNKYDLLLQESDEYLYNEKELSKGDLLNEDQKNCLVSLDRYEKKAAEKNIPFFAVSAYSGYNIDLIFEQMAIKCKQLYRPQDYDYENIVITERRKKKACC
ncbi:putative Ras small GTPase [Pseudoloma neurophilia]|uniref:Putative Ras small GTPase n=1 Tax=Pseudoloma neurophilia TaxID=146866 RepID=A0A0R0LZA3_9MICR|nr:putative Ras small GTPase [Pseudoloma neurophilia]